MGNKPYGSHSKAALFVIKSGGLLLLLAGFVVLQSLPGRTQPTPPANPLAALHFRFVGPIGNRVSAVIGEPGNPEVDYVGSSDGGVWKSTDGGVTWKPIFDKQDVAAIGALAMAPSAHNIIWAGTGETWLVRGDYPLGNGVYKSVDGGRTWQHMGLDQTGHVGRIVIDPHNPNRVFVCALGQAYKPQHERGIYRTMDGGKTWKQVLFVNDNTGCSDLAMDPHDPNTLFAGMWPVEIRTWDLKSGGTGGGVYVSHDGGNTWTKLSGHGLPPAGQPVGKTGIGIAPSNPRRVYALIQETGGPAFYRSDDGGASWTLVNRNHVMDQRPSYFTRFAVSPTNENRIYFVSELFSYSTNGGRTLKVVPSVNGVRLHDNHDVWVDPLNAQRIMIGNDMGAAISLNQGRTYQLASLPIAQIYHVFTDNDIPYHVVGNRQDVGGAFWGPSDALATPSGITVGEWKKAGGCESGFGVPDPVDANIVWAGCFDGQLTRMNLRTGQGHNVTPWPKSAYGWPPYKVKDRFNWTFPITISPEDHNKVYVGSQYVLETTDGGNSWKRISPDLTLNDKSHEQSSGGITTDNLMTFDGATLFAIAESPLKAGVIWTGSDDGQVNVTLDGGAHWTNVTKNIPNLPPWGTVENIEPSHFNVGTAYITVNFEEVGNYNPYVYETTDYGKTWKMISSTVPKSVNSSAHCVIEDPLRKGMLYLGTDNALYVTWDNGAHWTHLRNNLPPAPVYWLTIQKHFDDLAIATYGRGIWILDDLSPLRNYEGARQKPVYLFKPRSAYRFRRVDAAPLTIPNSHVIGQNPPYGADINFWLSSAANHVRIRILGPGNQEVRTMEVRGRAGLNRVWWNLRYDAPRIVKLRMPPPKAPWVKVGPKGWRPMVSWVNQFYKGAPLAAPGEYTVQLTAGGRQFSQPLTVLPDPHSDGTAAGIRADLSFLLQIRTELNEMAGMINHLESVRKQAAQEGSSGNAALASAVKTFEAKALAVESKLFDVNLTGQTEDTFETPIRIYGRLQNLGGTLNGQWGGGDSDMPPTHQEITVHKQLQEELAQVRREYRQFQTTAVPALNSVLRSHGLAPLRP